MRVPPPGLIVFGAKSTCDLATCDIEWTIYKYLPSLGANVALATLFGIICLVHIYLGFRWKSWGFMTGMVLGCVGEVLGYVGRVLLHENPFAYTPFMIQIVCLTIAPVFYSASIYVTLSKTINFYAPDLSRFKPSLFYWVFIPADLICLVLQSYGGAMSVSAKSNDRLGVNVSMAGLILQVVVLVAFIAAFVDYMFRYWRSGRMHSMGWRFKAFFAGLSTSVIFILIRCAYRVAELKDGYQGEMITHEAPFIVLEGVAIVIAAASLFLCHPGMVFKSKRAANFVRKGGESESDEVTSFIAGGSTYNYEPVVQRPQPTEYRPQENGAYGA